MSAVMTFDLRILPVRPNPNCEERFVWYSGRTWAWNGLTDHAGRMLLVHVFDDSKGVAADPSRVSECNHETIDGIRYFRGYGTCNCQRCSR